MGGRKLGGKREEEGPGEEVRGTEVVVGVAQGEVGLPGFSDSLAPEERGGKEGRGEGREEGRGEGREEGRGEGRKGEERGKVRGEGREEGEERGGEGGWSGGDEVERKGRDRGR